MATDVDFLRIVSDADLQRFMLVACPDGVMVASTDHRVVLYTGASEEIFGFTPVEVLNRKISVMFEPCDDLKRLAAELERCGTVANGQLTAVRKDGTRFPAGVRATLLRDRFGTLLGTVLFVRDRTEALAAARDPQERDEHMDRLGGSLDQAAKHDGMTGLLRRSSAVAAAEQALKECALAGRPFSVALFDIDRFADVNQAHGHIMGDRVLEVLAEVLRHVARSNDILGRFSGGQFVAFLPGASLSAVSAFAERVRTASQETPVPTDAGGDFYVSVSAGVAAIPESTRDFDAALELAGQRLLTAKRLGRNRVVAGTEGDGRNEG